MNLISLRHSSEPHFFATKSDKPGLGQRLSSGFRKLRQKLQEEDLCFAAIGLAEGGDVKGATELMEQHRAKKS